MGDGIDFRLVKIQEGEGRICMTSPKLVRRLVTWLVAPPLPPFTLACLVRWWESRRIPYNILIGGVGLVSLVVFFVSIESSGYLAAGEDSVEPMALILAPFVVNLCYTAGWVGDAACRLVCRDLPARFTPVLFAVGVAFSLCVVLLPGLLWSGYRVLQIVRLVE